MAAPWRSKRGPRAGDSRRAVAAGRAPAAGPRAAGGGGGGEGAGGGGGGAGRGGAGGAAGRGGGGGVVAALGRALSTRGPPWLEPRRCHLCGPEAPVRLAPHPASDG